MSDTAKSPGEPGAKENPPISIIPFKCILSRYIWWFFLSSVAVSCMDRLAASLKLCIWCRRFQWATTAAIRLSKSGQSVRYYSLHDMVLVRPINRRFRYAISYPEGTPSTMNKYCGCGRTSVRGRPQDALFYELRSSVSHQKTTIGVIILT